MQKLFKFAAAYYCYYHILASLREIESSLLSNSSASAEARNIKMNVMPWFSGDWSLIGLMRENFLWGE
jgi:hypothetical protein